MLGVKHMLRFTRNNYGMMALHLSHIALIVATGVIIAAVFSFIYYSDWQRDGELRNMASGLSSRVEGMDTRFFENTSLYFFPDKDYSFNVSLSSEYIILNAEGSWDKTVSVKYRFVVRPWPRVNNSDWVSGEDLHVYLKTLYGHAGNRSDPISKTDINSVKNYLQNEREQANKTLVLKPFYVNLLKPLYIDKVFIYYNCDGENGWDKKTDITQEFLIIYQKN